MRTNLLFYLLCIIIFSCESTLQDQDGTQKDEHTAIANQFIEAFYSFERDSLASTLSQAKASQPEILYYQEWAKCGNYEIKNRPECIISNDSIVICPITVKDDLIGALQMDFHVTDTFRLTIIDGQIHSVQTSSNDPDMYYEAKAWVKQNLPETIEVPCEGIWEGGPTPCDCVKAMVAGYKVFMEEKD
ncbi:MAG: hypothetical protein AAF242_08965 [Bacteroidota bacterium]